MSIALLLANLSEGGVQRVFTILANELAERGHQVFLIVVDGEGHYRRQISPKVQLVNLAKKRARQVPLALGRHLASINPDVLMPAQAHLNVVGTLVLKLMPWMETKVVLTDHTMLSQRTEVSKVERWIMRLTYPLADKIVGVSRAVMDDVNNIVHPRAGKLDCVHNPVVTPELEQRLHQQVDEPWRGTEGLPLLLTAGRLEPVKDHATLLRAFACLLETKPARLLILGSGSLRAELETLAASLGLEGSVRFVGHVDNPIAYMARSDVFVLTSKVEGLPTVLIEALYCGLTVVSTNCPGGVSEILEAGKHGRLVPVGDVEAIAKSILEALETPRDVAALKKRAMAFSVHNVTTKYERLFQDLLQWPEIDGTDANAQSFAKH